MEQKEQKRFIRHCEKYFGQKCKGKLAQQGNYEIEVEVLLFAPNKKYPFWKMVTMGVSDYQMPNANPALPDRNEYMLFFDKYVLVEEGRTDWFWYYEFLMRTATYAYFNKCYVSFAHSIDINTREQTDMVAANILLPEVIRDTKILRCKLAKDKTCACLQVMPITEDELQEKLKIGAKNFVDKFYPQDGEMMFLAEKKRKGEENNNSKEDSQQEVDNKNEQKQDNN